MSGRKPRFANAGVRKGKGRRRDQEAFSVEEDWDLPTQVQRKGPEGDPEVWKDLLTKVLFCGLVEGHHHVRLGP